MVWLGLFVCCLAASALVHWQIRLLILAVPVACLAGPLLYLLVIRSLGHKPDALDGLVLIFGQPVAVPAAVIVGACFYFRRTRPAA